MTYRGRLLAATSIDAEVLRQNLQTLEERRVARARASGAFIIDMDKTPKYERRYAPVRGGKGLSNSIARYFK